MRIKEMVKEGLKYEQYEVTLQNSEVSSVISKFEKLKRDLKVSADAILAVSTLNVFKYYVMDDVITYLCFNNDKNLCVNDFDISKNESQICSDYIKEIYTKINNKNDRNICCDDSSVLVCVNKQNTKEEMMQYNVFFCAKYEIFDDRITIKIDYIPKYGIQVNSISYIAHYLWISLEKIVLMPELELRQQKLINYIECENIIKSSKGVVKKYSNKKGIYEYFLDQVRNHGDEIAVVDCELKERKLSYRELYIHVINLEKYLKHLGADKDSVIGVNIERSSKAIIAILTICKMGAICVPLDKAYPKEFVTHILNDSGMTIMISDERCDISGVANFNISEIDEIDQMNYVEDVIANNVEINPNDIRFIYYTSGSTGKPKGTTHPETHIINEALWRMEKFPLSSMDIIGQRCTISIAASAYDLLHGAMFGIKTVIIPQTVLLNPHKLISMINKYKISWICLTPSLIDLLASIDNDECKTVTSLRYINILGEKLKKELFDSFRSKFPKVLLTDKYGCTEVFGIMVRDLNTPAQNDIGFEKIYNVNAYVLSKDNEIVPYGAIGEICVSGDMVRNSGYHNLNELNNLKFTEWRPSNTWEVERLYRTGDVGYLLPTGESFLIERMDFVAKINGKRVDLKGVESLILQINQVKEAVVVAKNITENKTDIYAYITVNGTIETKDIIKKIRNYVPDYMVPKHIKIIESIPRLSSGKVNYKLIKNKDFMLENNDYSHNIDSIFERIVSILGYLLNEVVSEEEYNTEFSILGLDSILNTKFAMILSQKLDIDISPSDIYDYPTVNKLYSCIAKSKNTSVPKHYNIGKSEDISQNDNIAIVGMSGRFPDAKNIDEFWNNLYNSKNSIREIPQSRWKINGFYDPIPGKENYSYSRWGGFLDDIDQFDAKFFGITPKEAIVMDPQQRLCLMESYRALEDAGCLGKTNNVGVFIGASNNDYIEILSKAGINTADSVLGNSMSMLAARISYYHNFTGPSMVVDTACSSSLVALHLACQSLKAGECDIALVGGVSIINTPSFYLKTSKLNVFSPTGKCKVFDDKADGFVSGEGVAFVVLKRNQEAHNNNDNIYAVIKGTAINQDGRTNGITAPNGISQMDLQMNLFNKIGISPERVSYIETHGTGTKLGDLIELKAIDKLFKKYNVEASHRCALGSVKTNIGHLIAAAGITSLIKTALCIYNKTLVATLNHDEPNTLFDWNNSSVYVNTETKEWEVKNGEKRIAGINSLGIGGTNAYCVLEEVTKNIECNRRVTQPAYNFNTQSYYMKYCSCSDENSIKDSDDGKISDFRELLSEYINIENNDINQDATLVEYGLDSLKLISLKNKIYEIFYIKISLDDLINNNIRQIMDLTNLQNVKNSTQNDNVVRKYEEDKLDITQLSDEELVNLYDNIMNRRR